MTTPPSLNGQYWHVTGFRRFPFSKNEMNVFVYLFIVFVLFLMVYSTKGIIALSFIISAVL